VHDDRDGELVFRFLLGLEGDALVDGAANPTGTRSTSSAVRAYLAGAAKMLDVDGNGTTDALTDGVLIRRFLRGLQGSELVQDALGLQATRTDPENLWLYMNGYWPGLAGDINGDARVDLSDFGLFKSAFGRGLAVGDPTDLDRNGRVDLSDFGLLKASFGAAAGAERSAAAADQVFAAW
jgi:hypothetical protein